MSMRRSYTGLILGSLLFFLAARPAAADAPPWLPRYDLDAKVDVANHQVRVRQRVAWTNRHQRPAHEIVFNVHSHYDVPARDVGLLAKTLEMLRLDPGEALNFSGPAGSPLCDRMNATMSAYSCPFRTPPWPSGIWSCT